MAERRKGRPGSAAVLASAALHVLLLLLVWWRREAFSSLPEFMVYELTLVEPPPAELGEPETAAPQRPVVDRPQPEPEKESPPPPEVKRTEPTRAARDDREARPRRDEPREAEKPRGPNPQPGGREAGSGLNVRLEGFRTDFPEYFENIVRQLTRYFRWRSGGSWEAEVAFMIQSDGGVAEIRWVRRSGNFAFDLEAMGAVESAGRDGAFGPLPQGFPADHLPVSFYFKPVGSP
ncbi:MAG: TonB C-terminal domain-containing protein [Gemmatimonadetes bacterium]|nr:TonB C-terminal domain-containing protein [Gemmatimonadota bacterium]